MGKTKEEEFYLILNRLLEESYEMESVINPYLVGITHSFSASRVSLMLVDHSRHELFIHEALGIQNDIKKTTRVQIGDGIAGWVAEKGESIVVRNIDNSDKFKGEKKQKGFKSNSFMCIPLKVQGKVYGVLNVSEKEGGQEFTVEELRKLEVLGMQIAILVENQCLKKEIEWLKERPMDQVAEISHDFRIPLTCLQEVLNMLVTKELGPINKDQEEFLSIANRSVKRMIKTFGDLISLATTVREHKPVLEDVDFVAMVREINQGFEAKARQRKVKIAEEIEEGTFKLSSDSRRLSEAVMNLVDNALKYTKEGTTIQVRLFKKPKSIRFEVEDQGPGIPEEQKDKIFSKSAAVDRVKTSSKEESAQPHGLGLAISKDLVSAIGGDMGYQNKSAGEGTVFYLELPKKD